MLWQRWRLVEMANWRNSRNSHDRLAIIYARVYQMLLDVAGISIDHAKERYKDMARKMERQRKEPFKATFLVADAGDCCLADHYEPKDREFDLASCQFALHYSFADEERASQFLKNATERIRPGGYFIGTLPDAYQIV